MNADSLSFEQLCELFNYTPKNRPLSSAEAAAVLLLAPNTMEQHRLRGTGPRYFQPAGTRRVLYSEKDVLAWLASGARISTSQPVDHAALTRAPWLSAEPQTS
ncbi:helix-turn-helix transcriptional regulator [Pseudomonas aeruginosa]|uniref:helix-turn-helix transcriptional regulator n=1 Tax=Pseudomonadota TaxID=1224 RepID=UPI00201933A6|nr:DNA-binding protein [Burkholderia multivorans]UQN68566.1 DNA-binding protein [Burkholderia multivorans]UQN74293.1 DNA-binding protein [Burkholderia multivorans]